MGKALYRKYRSKTLSEVIGQEHITTALGNALKKGAVSHAYLFTGPRGTGKTSTARILAHEINGLPYDNDQTHLDIIEIDAASNRRIEEIRDLRERVHTAPTQAKYKVYIIDEVHMLTKEAFNALLKTLEEPPEHVIFILATTEAHKLPETIISRTQRYTFKPIDLQAVIGHLRSIAQAEKLDISDDALTLIAQHGGGSFRDSISLLDQARSIGGTVSLADIQRLLGIAPEQAIATLWQAIEDHSPATIVQILHELRTQGYQSAQLAKQLAARFRQALLDGHPEPDRMMTVLRTLLEVPVSHDSDAALELALMGLVLEYPVSPAAPAASTPVVTAPVQPQPVPKPKALPTLETPLPQATKPEAAEPKIINGANPVTATAQPAVAADLSDEVWQDVLGVLKQQYKTLYSVMRMAQTSFEADKLTLGFKFAFHQKRVNDARNKQIILDLLKQKTGKNIALALIVTQDAPSVSAARTTSDKSVSKPLEAVTNIFGGGEILDS